MFCTGVKLEDIDLYLFESIGEIFLEGCFSLYYSHSYNVGGNEASPPSSLHSTPQSPSTVLSTLPQNERFILLRHGPKTVLRFIERHVVVGDNSNNTKEIRIHHATCEFLASNTSNTTAATVSTRFILPSCVAPIRQCYAC